jgi:proline dehydrogenase
VAFPKKIDVDANYDLLVRLLITKSQELGFPKLSPDGKTPPIPAIATHDAIRIKCAIDNAVVVNMPKEALEFQMLHGIRRDLQEQLVKQGYPVRIYVPFGTHWYPYFMRRLAERPSNLWFFVSNFFRK